MFKIHSVVLAGFLCIASGCAEETAPSGTLDIVSDAPWKLVGPKGNDIDKRYRPLIGAIGFRRGSAPGFPGDGDCTFTHIGKGIALTAAHCVCGSKKCEYDFEIV